MYVAAYREPADCDETLHNGIVALNDGDPNATLDEVVANCKELGINADLYDSHGFRAGWVHADGTYNLA